MSAVKALLVSVSIGALTSTAYADGLRSGSVKDQPATASGFSWTGCYVGGTIGAVGLTTDGKSRYENDKDYSGYDAKASGTLTAIGITGGCNYQVNRFVMGFEGDYSKATGSAAGSQYGYDSGTPGYGSTYIQSIATSMSSFSTFRGRLGYTLTDRTLVYATGGYMWAKLNTSFQSDEDSDWKISYSQNKSNWVFGGGVEHALTNSITLKMEALRVDQVWHNLVGGV